MRPSVLLEGTIFLLQARGGIPRYFGELLPRMAPSVDLSLFLGFNSRANDDLRSGLNFRSCWYRKSPSFPHSRTLYRKLNAVWLETLPEGTADIYHRSFDYSPVRPKWARRQVTTVYDLIPENFPGLMKADAMQMRRQAFQDADGLLAISRSTALDLMERYEIPAEKISVTHLGVDHAFWSSGPPVEAMDSLLYVGQRGSYKNFGLLVRAFAQARLRADTTLLCFGGGEFSSAERELFRELSVAGRIQQKTGSDTDLRSAYRSSIALVYPSLYEGFGLPILEAMCSECPVISSASSSLPEVGGQAALYFDPHSVEELAHHLELVCSDAGLRQALARKGLAQSAHFSWEECASQTVEFYRALI